ncbi:MAG: hypothetical protein KBB71_00405 [Lentimicrobiaceae bacterium]|nr:hypothetical protein [Lentimicrobiaceae bacterium]
MDTQWLVNHFSTATMVAMIPNPVPPMAQASGPKGVMLKFGSSQAS